jgi:hypothetical protein
VKSEIIHIDSHDRKISLSERGAVERAAGDGGETAEGDEAKPAKKKSSRASARLGDVMGDLSRKLKDKSEAQES